MAHLRKQASPVLEGRTKWRDGLSCSPRDYLRKKSEGDPDQVAEDIWEFIAEIACGIGSLMRYDENKSVDRRVITGRRRLHSSIGLSPKAMLLLSLMD